MDTNRHSSLGGAVRRVLAVVAVARLAQFVEAVLFPLVAVEHGAGTTGAALVLLSLAAGTTVGSVLGGGAVDGLGPRSVAIAGLAGAAAAAAALALGTTIGVLAPAALTYGLATGAWRLALEAATAHGLARSQAEDDQAARERAFGAFLWLVNVGALVSAALLVAGLDLQVAVGLQAAATALASALAALVLPRPVVRAEIHVPRLHDVPAALWMLALAYAPFTMVMFQAFAGLAQVFDDSEYRLMVLVNALTLVIFPPLLWSRVSRVDGVVALCAAGVVQGTGVAVGALLRDPVVSTIAWSAGEATLIAVIPAVVAGIAPHRFTGRYRAGFATVQGAAAAAATFAGPVIAAASLTGFALACLALTAIGAAGIATRARAIGAALHQPVACPCGALLCSCDVSHADCAFPSPILVHTAQAPDRSYVT